MNTITAKELRDNLGKIAKRVSAGEHIYVSYRNKLSFKLEPVTEPKETRHKLAGLDAFLAAPKKPIPKKYREGNLESIYWEEMAKKHDL